MLVPHGPPHGGLLPSLTSLDIYINISNRFWKSEISSIIYYLLRDIGKHFIWILFIIQRDYVQARLWVFIYLWNVLSGSVNNYWTFTDRKRWIMNWYFINYICYLVVNRISFLFSFSFFIFRILFSLLSQHLPSVIIQFIFAFSYLSFLDEKE